MKRLGFRSVSVSTEENADARTKPSQTTEPQLFYIVCCTPYFFQINRFFGLILQYKYPNPINTNPINN